ncbi:cell division protein FtsZ [Suttonella ornithocola]|uniref:Cell division protein FtsZ n=1 Tax=Suttonella ornithocola TaxID=279832 RepID=A0A380MXA5_9GAMM|nr:cell division protein FtsZ [Suttonella ornithocola]SUO97230.1 Cell division protein FtsZ [Suttonella ornithocola]
MAFELLDEQDISPQVLIKVIGVGGGGCNAVKQMMDFDLEGVELICANTDMQVLNNSPIPNKLQLGVHTTRGMGAGSKPEIGRKAAEEDSDRIREILSGADMVFIAAGMGGGTGTGAAPVISSIAREMGILTVAIVTKPFSYEGAKRMRMAEQGLEVLKEEVDCLIIIPNDRISDIMDEEITIENAFKIVDGVLKDGVQGIANVIQREGLINTDLEDVKTIMSERGIGIMGTGEAKGEDRARTATEKAISSPLLENIDLSSARGLLVNVSASRSVKMSEYNTVGQLISELIDEDRVNAKLGLLIDEDLGDTLRVTVIATGIDSSENQEEESEEEIPDLLGTISNKPNNEKQTDKAGQKGDGYLDNLNIPAILRRRVK